MIIKCNDKNLLEEVIEIYVETYSQEPWNEPWTLEMADKKINTYLKNPNAKSYISIIDGKVVGFIMGHINYYLDQCEFSIEEFIIKKEYQGKGIGTKMLNYVEEDLKKIGIDGIILLTGSGFPSEKFYEKNKFRKLDRVIVMKKDLHEENICGSTKGILG